MELMKISPDLLREAIVNREFKKLRTWFDEFNIVDLAQVVDHLELIDILPLFKILNKEVGGELFSYLDNDTIEKLTHSLDESTLKNILEQLYLDDLSDILSELPDNLVKKVLTSVSPELRKDINTLLSYPENSCGSIMSVDFVTLREDYTVAQAIKSVRRQGKMAETINWVYVSDPKGTLVGYLPLKDLLLAPDDAEIIDLMDSDVIYVTTLDDQETAAKLISKYDLTAIPVTDTQRNILGIITVDDILDVVEEEATEDIHKMAAITPIEGSYLEASLKTMVRSRITWLLVLMISATFTGSIINANTNLLVHFSSLAVFIPMLMDTSGNAGSQATAMVIRGITVDDLTYKDFFKIFWKEFSVSLLLGAALFIINTLRIGLLMDAGWLMAILVSFTVFLTITMANLVGGLLPLFALIIKQDPAAMAAPLITTICDALALLTYFAIAGAFLR